MQNASTSIRSTLLPAMVVALLAACNASPAPATAGPGSPKPSAMPTALPSITASSAPTTASDPKPVCPDRNPPWAAPDQAAAVKDGPDPDGRLVFGIEVRMDDVLGQVVGPMFAMDPDGTDLVRISTCNVERPRFSPDGSRLAFSIEMDDGTWQVATSKVDGTDLRILTHTKGLAETPDWGPDGSWLIYSLGSEPCDPWPDCIETGGFHYNLWRMNADGSDQHLIGDPDAIDWEPRVSPSGREVVFTRYIPENAFEPTITILNLRTGEVRPATTDNQRPEHPDWTRDGRSVVYTSHWDAEGVQQIKVVPANNPSADPIVLFGTAGRHGFKAAYAPDGSRIVFGCGPAMCLMDPDGGNVVELLRPAGAFPNHFAWGPAVE